ncbi:GntR family transcriptional regulator [Pectobacterium atrosepticum]|uniref:GntR family transcriptional regulator n=1 Tax=Pectobacterium atrosepticum TaxID=29471 RepID=UPI00039AD29C|nr:GntR family transcriptional regulator [Pectobacterium atrosepticum]GKV85979.1 GntR family transcriptional regulator [Pectobacterium carotovorum subsp. carotovorum]AIA69364.1 GntR family transcriptional regulator [Pectobacterium atrosepticum]AIK12271.1 GntR-family transcriptional regulator [Pectobacterium atrosepticum]ATY89212.1 GntR family transcriptional regulator [Pectobacterium atrosepticum]KFX15788.1 GntR family transcriptional regulator [Pectobacterium atrosepticum]
MRELLLWVRDQLAGASSAPRYMQLASLLESEIGRRKTLSGQFLPAERLIAQQLGLSRVTVSRSLSLLEEKGLVVRQQGVGTRVTQRLNYALSAEDEGFTALVLKQGGIAGSLWLERSIQVPPASIAEKMSLPEGEAVTYLRRVRLSNGEPVSLETTWIPQKFLPDPETLEQSLYQYWITGGVIPDKKRYRFKAIACAAEIATLLGIAAEAPALYCQLHVYNEQGELLEYSEAHCRSDVYEIQFAD